jgi:hypothetical protein
MGGEGRKQKGMNLTLSLTLFSKSKDVRGGIGGGSAKVVLVKHLKYKIFQKPDPFNPIPP